MGGGAGKDVGVDDHPAGENQMVVLLPGDAAADQLVLDLLRPQSRGADISAVWKTVRRSVWRIVQTTCKGEIDEPTTSAKRGVNVVWFSALKRTICQSRREQPLQPPRAHSTPANPPPTITTVFGMAVSPG